MCAPISMTTYVTKIRSLFTAGLEATSAYYLSRAHLSWNGHNVSLCNIAVRVVIFTFHVIFVDEPEILLIKYERCNFFLNITHLSIFFLISFTLRTPRFLVISITSATSKLWAILFWLFMIRTMAAWVSNWRSACTRSCVSRLSSFVSLSCTWLILTRYFSCEKLGLSENVSVSLISRPIGCFRSGRSLAQARDWRVRLSSGAATC